MARILLVDDEQGILNTLTILLKGEGYETTAALGAEKALEILLKNEFALMISDIRMAPMNGIELLHIVHDKYPLMSVIMLTAYGQVDTAIEANQLGAFDYVKKPFRTEELMMAIEKALDYHKILANPSDS
ncbi:MAG: response regulator [Kiritimatiellae bacterium]|nr:response regulator [Kiritimatiellia bacterium]MDD5522422.1 response regulator [Kiritimatiellia bacterium]